MDPCLDTRQEGRDAPAAAPVEGQVRGVQRMVDDDAYCIDVLTQISAATKALQAVALELLDQHLAHCVADAVAAGGATRSKIAEASAAMRGRTVVKC